MSKSGNWKEFERLTSRIENALVPRGAIVKSPDKIPELVSGDLRDVDVSIRYQIGTVPVLITVECQDRSRKASKPWIEQLITKKALIGASATIAVTIAGFSKPAVCLARQHGIELRELREVNESTIFAWLKPVECMTAGYRFKLIKMLGKIVPVEGVNDFYDLAASGNTSTVKALIRSYDKKYISAYDIINVGLGTWSSLSDLPRDGSTFRFDLHMNLPDGSVLFPTPDGNISLESLRFELSGVYEEHSQILSNGKRYEYQEPDGKIVQRVEYQLEISNKPLLLGLQATDREDRIYLHLLTSPNSNG